MQALFTIIIMSNIKNRWARFNKNFTYQFHFELHKFELHLLTFQVVESQRIFQF